MTADRYDVVIIGYGPVGQVAANLLGRNGRRVAVFETATSVYNLPRAAHFDAEIMRIFQSIGVCDALAPAIEPIQGMHFLDAAGEKLFGFDAPDRPTENGWPAGYFFYQPELESALQDAARQYASVDVFAGHEVAHIAQTASGVDVAATSIATGESVVVAADYAVGCDGARSLTRRTIGAELEDLRHDQPWLVVDTMLKRPVELPSLALQICDPARPTTFIPQVGAHRRWEFMLMPGDTPEAMERPERAWELLQPWITEDDATIIRSVVYTFHALIAKPWRTGRIFLAGDAAHQMPPFLGQGMCAGIRDVNNLAWKLDLVKRGLAGDAVLDTYEIERAPHVRTIIGRAIQAGGIIQTTDPGVAARRDAMLRASGSSSTTEQGAGRLESRMPGLVDGILASCQSEAAPVGQILPQSVLASGERTDARLGDGFALVADHRLPAKAVEAWRWLSPAIVTDAGRDPQLSGWLATHGTAVVRPDRYVFGVARDDNDLPALSRELRQQLQPSATPDVD